MSQWLALINQLASPEPCVSTEKASGGASEIYGLTESMILKAVDGMLSFRVPDVVRMTGLNRVRANRTLVKLSKKGIVTGTKCYDPFGRAIPTIWRLREKVTCSQ